MYAVTVAEPGGPEMLTWSEVPDPVVGPGEVLIEVCATAVNRADLLQRAGHYPPPRGASPYLGLECSGVVAAVGSGVTDVRPGDEVVALLAGGGYAQRVVVPAGQVLPVPRGMDLADAAALPEAACTVWSNVFDQARLSPAETLLVHGGGSGVGTFAIQLAVATGAQVVTTARAAKHPALLELGAAVAIDYSVDDFVAATREATGGRGADVILDIVGAAYLSRNLAALAPEGRLAIIGLQGGRRADLDLSALLAVRGTVFATTLRSRSVEEKARIVRQVHQRVWPLLTSGAVRPVVDRRLPLTEAAEAHRIVEASSHLGKVVLIAPAVDRSGRGASDRRGQVLPGQATSSDTDRLTAREDVAP